jgi:hypothetical protein
MFHQDGRCATTEEVVYVNPSINRCLSAKQSDGMSTFPDVSACTLDTTSKALGTTDPMLTSTYRLSGLALRRFRQQRSRQRPRNGKYDRGASELAQP